MTTSHDSGRSVASSPYPLDAGVTLKAAEALDGQQTWTREQVAYVVALAYWSGAGVLGRHDAAELAEFAYAATLGTEWRTPEQRVAERIAAMERADEYVKLRRKPTWPRVQAGQRTGLREFDRSGHSVPPQVVPVGQPCDPDVAWPEVTMPGGKPC